MYNGEKYSGRKGFYATCGGGQTEPGRAIHIPLTIWKPTIVSFTGVGPPCLALDAPHDPY